jgi:hypothetical protein
MATVRCSHSPPNHPCGQQLQSSCRFCFHASCSCARAHLSAVIVLAWSPRDIITDGSHLPCIYFTAHLFRSAPKPFPLVSHWFHCDHVSPRLALKCPLFGDRSLACLLSPRILMMRVSRPSQMPSTWTCGLPHPAQSQLLHRHSLLLGLIMHEHVLETCSLSLMPQASAFWLPAVIQQLDEDGKQTLPEPSLQTLPDAFTADSA